MVKIYFVKVNHLNFLHSLKFYIYCQRWRVGWHIYVKYLKKIPKGKDMYSKNIFFTIQKNSECICLE